MSWHTQLTARLDRMEASTKRIKARLLRYLAQQTGQTEEQVWAGLVRDLEQQQTATTSRP